MDRLQQPEACVIAGRLVRALHEAVLDEQREPVQHLRVGPIRLLQVQADSLRRIQRPAIGKIRSDS